MKKLLSRKFLIALLVAVSGVLMGLDAFVDSDVLVKIAGLVSAALASLGYSVAEGKVDAARLLSGISRPVGDSTEDPS